MSLHSDSKILIVGGGIVGLALGQILRKHNITFEIFEREVGFGSEGWGLHLDKCLPDLLHLFPTDLEDLRAASPNFTRGVQDSFAFYNSKTGELQGISGNLDQDESDLHVGAGRNALRRILAQHLPMSTGRSVESYTQDAGGVTLHFTDGITARGDVLIGADGARSRIRKQLIGVEAVISKFNLLQGTAVLPQSVYAPLVEHGKCGCLLGELGKKASILATQYNPDGTAVFMWAFAYRVVGREEEERAWTRHASSREMFEKVVGFTRHWPEWWKTAIAYTDPETGMRTPPTRLMEVVIPDDQLPAGRVTLMGDASHAMAPFAGMGANTGVMDAIALGPMLIEGIRNGSDISTLLRRYEAENIPRGRDTVLVSRKAGEDENDDLAGGRLTKLPA